MIACINGSTEDVVVGAPVSLENRLIGQVDPLDDPGHYYIDIPGAGIVINPIHKRRELSLRAGEGTESTLITWSFTESGFWPE